MFPWTWPAGISLSLGLRISRRLVALEACNHTFFWVSDHETGDIRQGSNPYSFTGLTLSCQCRPEETTRDLPGLTFGARLKYELPSPEPQRTSHVLLINVLSASLCFNSVFAHSCLNSRCGDMGSSSQRWQGNFRKKTRRGVRTAVSSTTIATLLWLNPNFFLPKVQLMHSITVPFTGQ